MSMPSGPNGVTTVAPKPSARLTRGALHHTNYTRNCSQNDILSVERDTDRAGRDLDLSKKPVDLTKSEDVLVKFMTSAPVVALVLEGPHAVGAVRKTVGATRAYEAAAGTIDGGKNADTMKGGEGNDLVRGKPVADIDYVQVAKKTEGFSGADMKAVVDQAVEAAAADKRKLDGDTAQRIVSAMRASWTSLSTGR